MGGGGRDIASVHCRPQGGIIFCHISSHFSVFLMCSSNDNSLFFNFIKCMRRETKTTENRFQPSVADIKSDTTEGNRFEHIQICYSPEFQFKSNKVGFTDFNQFKSF